MAAVAFVLLFIRSRYGFSYDDEPFLLTLAQRLYHGDSLFIDEWNFAQNVGVLLLPFYRLYIALFGTLDSILLVFRGLYCFFWVGTCTIIFLVFRKKYKGAWAVYLYLLLFSPLDQMIMSYTSIALMCVLLLAALFFRHIEVKQMKLWAFTILFSALTIIAVIASPYLGIVYGMYVLGCVIFALWRRNERGMFFLKVALWSVVIAGGTLILYAWRFILNNYSVTVFIEKLPNMFATSNMGTAVSSRGTSILRSVIEFWRYQIFVAGITFLVTLIPKVRKSTLCRMVLFAGNVLVFGYELLQQFGVRGRVPYLNLQMVPIVFLGAVAWWLIENKKKVRTLFCALDVLGVCYTVVCYVSSDTGLPALSMGLTVCGVCGILMIGQLTGELVDAVGKTKRAICEWEIAQWMKRVCHVFLTGLTVLVFVSQIFTQSYLKIHRHYWDVSVPEMDGVITMGASKGIRTEKEDRVDPYEKRMEALEHLLQYVDMEKGEDIRFLSLVFDPDVYLNADLPVGCYSTWAYAKNEAGGWPVVEKKMNRYYAENPSKIPNVIFASLVHDWDVAPTPEVVDLNDFTPIYYGHYVLYVAPELVAE